MAIITLLKKGLVYLYFYVFYDKHVYFFYNEYAGSSEPHWEHKLFLT